SFPRMALRSLGFSSLPLTLSIRIDPVAVAEAIALRRPVVVVDVREPWEFEINRIEGARLIPLGALAGRVNELSTADSIVLSCLSGHRSAQAARLLNGLGFKRAKSLRGGMRAWVSEVHPELPTY
ncbi:MAG: rhodanese-like domain-containing protein, partial [Nitrososphaerota archaeon]|nr:rhodanese-like domain-containing protein [Nitrososphaerota archaeon]